MNLELDRLIDGNGSIDENIDSSSNIVPGPDFPSYVKKKTLLGISDNTSNHIEYGSSNITECSNHSDDSNHSQKISLKNVASIANRNDSLDANIDTNHQNHCMDSNDSSTQSSDNSQTKKDSIYSKSDSESVQNDQELYPDDSKNLMNDGENLMNDSEDPMNEGDDSMNNIEDPINSEEDPINEADPMNDTDDHVNDIKEPRVDSKDPLNDQSTCEESDYESDDSRDGQSAASKDDTSRDPASVQTDSESENLLKTGNSNNQTKTSDIEDLDIEELRDKNKKVNNGQNNANGLQVHNTNEIGSDNEEEEFITTADIDSIKNKSIEGNGIEPNEESTGLTPRRSARAVKRKSYKENDDDIVKKHKIRATAEANIIELQDPLNEKPVKRQIFVSDTKKLVDLASRQPKTNLPGQKKEPTLVIIDTNSILSGKGPVPVLPKPLLPTSLSQQNLYQSIAARGTTVTPVSMKQVASLSIPSTIIVSSAPTSSIPSSILPSLTDDMFVVEAPSFIVPYVYEKPSVKPFREFVDAIGKDLEEKHKKEEIERLERDKLNKEKLDKEKLDIQNLDKEKKNADEEEQADGVSTGDGNNDNSSINANGLENKCDLKLKKHEKKNRRRKDYEDDASWDGSSTESDDLSEDEDAPKTEIIKEKDDPLVEIKDAIVNEPAPTDIIEKKSDSYFDNSLGKFFISVGVNLVQEYVQYDLLKLQKRKLQKENRSGSANVKATEAAIASLMKNLNYSIENNAPYKFEEKKCEFCSFKSESVLVMAHHMETPHMKNNIYKCNFCEFEIRSPHDILYHMEAEHNIRGRLERAPAYHQCANCPFEDNVKGKLARHLVACAKKFKPEANLGPPIEWEPPAKIPKMARARNAMMNSTYQTAFNRSQAGVRPQLNIGGTTLVGSSSLISTTAIFRGRGRPQLPMQQMPTNRNSSPMQGITMQRGAGGVILRPPNPQSLLPPNYNIMGSTTVKPVGPQTKGSSHHPSISITPLPRAPQPSQSGVTAATVASGTAAKGTFVICEICDGYIKDLEQLRNHMQWIHKVKIHPKMIHNRPPLNCQKCQFRFFTDQGLERHLLGSHGLVTSSMQEAANKGKDAGRCPVCGRVYQWKLLHHVARDHNITLKPAHLSYKCTVCTSTFGMYKQFENHVYSAHSVVAKRVMDKTKPLPASPAGSPVLKPSDNTNKLLRINNEITIIPQNSKTTAELNSNSTTKD